MRYSLFFFALFSFNLSAFQLNTFFFNDAFSFPYTTVFDIVKSDDDVVWFGTNEGLVSFDGVRFCSYSHVDYDIAYTHLKFDKYGRIWCVNFSGQLFYLEDDTLKLALDLPYGGEYISHYSVQKLPEIEIVRFASGEIVHFDLTTGKESFKFAKDSTNIYPLFEQSEYYTVDKHSKSNTCLLSLLNYKDGHFEPSNTFSPIDIFCISGKFNVIPSDVGLIVYHIGETSDVYRIDREGLNHLFSIPEVNQYNFNHFSVIGKNAWVLTKTGAQVWSLTQNKLMAKVLDNVSVSSALQDNEGNIWLGTLNRGVYVMQNMFFMHKPFGQIHVSQLEVTNADVFYIQDDRGVIYRSYPPYDEVERILEAPLEPAPMFFDKTLNRLYIGHRDKYFDVEKNKLIESKPSKKPKYIFKKAASIGHGDFVGTSYATSFISTDSKERVLDFPFFRTNEKELRMMRSNHIVSTPNSLYIDYIDGLFYFTDDQQIKKVTYKGTDIQTAYLTRDVADTNVVWVVTKTRNVHKLKNGRIIKTINLPQSGSNLVSTHDYLFIAYKKGVYRYDIRKELLESINESNGLIPSIIRGIHVWNGSVFLVGGNLIQSFPESVKLSLVEPPSIHLDYIKIGDKFTYDYNDEIVVPKNNNSLTVGFRALSIRSHQKVDYQYRLQGKSNDWISTQSNTPEIRFFNLSPDHYQLELRARSVDGLSSDSIRVNFSVPYPYYQQWWFVLSFVILFGVFLWWLVQRRYRIREEKNRLISEREVFQKDVYKSKIAALRSQMNPHFMFNALNAIQEFILTNQQRIASEYLADFADLMRMYLSQSTKDKVSIAEEEELLRLYLRLENMRFNNSIDVDIYVDPNIDKDSIYIPLMLLQPHVENSIKHGLLHANQPKKLSIHFVKTSPEEIQFTIEDNGIGREASKKFKSKRNHNSFSTEANTDRIRLINQMRDRKIKLKITDLYQGEKPTGTRVDVFLPI